ncbi:MAG: hypothetical protein F6K55_29415 [Moorea sp. SIO4A3]|nr:hypothetical protein [Moorena sp. SIO4A3]
MAKSHHSTTRLSDAARSWGGSAVLGVSPMSDCRGFPHERLHQEEKNRKDLGEPLLD